MPEPQLPGLLTLLGVERVLVVDDQFTPPASVYTLAFAVGEGPAVDGLPAMESGADYEDHVQRHWGDVSLTDKLSIQRQARKVEGFDDPTGDPTGLRQHVGDRDFRGMTLHEWETVEERLLGASKRSLILFDVNFELETGDPQDEMGLGPAGRALNATHDHIVGLLTTKAVGDEEGTAAVWAQRAQVQRAELVVVNKRLLADPENEDDLTHLVEQIRTTLQASQIGTLRAQVQEALESGLAAASRSIAGRTPEVLEDVVFRASRDGGEWEGDTWFRLYGTLGLKRAREDVARNKHVRRATADVRNLLHSRPQAAHDDSAALAAKVQKAEAYDRAEYLNEAGLPIANGDIFKTRTGRAFILVGQPCDLMLRPDGRAKDPSTATLLPIKRRDGEQEDNETSSYRLPLGAPLEEDGWEVRFRPEYHVGFEVLDLVSLNTEGRASLKPPRGTGLAPLLPGLDARLTAITRIAEESGKLLEFIDDLVKDKTVGNQLRQRVLQSGGPFKATLSAKPTPFSFDCQRVGRLTGTYADALLAAHASARSRTAHAHELTRIVPTAEPSRELNS